MVKITNNEFFERTIMANQNEKELISRLFDGDFAGVSPSDVSRDDWKLYSIIGDSIRNESSSLSKDVSDRVLAGIKSYPVEREGFLKARLDSFLGYLKNWARLPRGGSFQFASVAIVFAMGFSADNIIDNYRFGDINNFYVESGVQSIAALNPSEQESDCDISEVFIDELIMHHERLSGSSDLC